MSRTLRLEYHVASDTKSFGAFGVEEFKKAVACWRSNRRHGARLKRVWDDGSVDSAVVGYVGLRECSRTPRGRVDSIHGRCRVMGPVPIGWNETERPGRRLRLRRFDINRHEHLALHGTRWLDVMTSLRKLFVYTVAYPDGQTYSTILTEDCDHVEDNQGLCHNCGTLLNRDRWEAYAGTETPPPMPLADHRRRPRR